MTCYTPLDGFLGPQGRWVSDTASSIGNIRMQIACGQCLGCRLQRSRDWGVRCVHHAQTHRGNAAFITLTYRDAPPSLQLREWQLFCKKLRKSIEPNRIQFLMCGEYGALNRRPHWHAIIFGWDFPDRVAWQETPAKETIYRSEHLEKLWPHGYSSIGNVTFKSAAYVARYVMKKQNGGSAERRDPETGLSHYELLNAATGEIHQQSPEMSSMSKRPALGAAWFDAYWPEVYGNRTDQVVIEAKKFKPPRFYDKLLERAQPDLYEEIKQTRIETFNTPEARAEREEQRLADRHLYKQFQLMQLQRNLE